MRSLSVPALALGSTVLVTGSPTHAATPRHARPAPRCGELRATIVGTFGDDQLVGTRGRHVIAGLGGDDTIKGLGGNDMICGGAGATT